MTDDAIFEASETVIVTMGTPTNATQGSTTVHTATITDNDTAPTVEWTSSSQTNAESVTTVTVTAQLSAASGQNVTVPYTLSGTAIDPSDYTVTASPLTITAGSTTASLTITVVDDAIDEANETVIVTMGSPTNATQGSTTVHTATITDNDAAPTVEWTAASQTTAENAGTVTIVAQLSAVSGQNVTVPFTITGTATGGGTDYTITASPITITAGSTTASISVNVISDVLSEPDETVIATMGSPTNATQGSTTVHTLTITDTTALPTVAFTSGSQTNAESVTTVTVTAQLSAVSALDVTVPYTLSGTATGGGTDYSITASPITILAGSTTGTITITVVNDALNENSETDIVTMGAPINATQGATTVHTATITDNDSAPPVEWTASSQRNDESTTTVTITAQFDEASV